MIKLKNRGLLMVVGGTLIVDNGCFAGQLDTSDTIIEKVPDTLFFDQGKGKVSFIGTQEEPIPFFCG